MGLEIFGGCIIGFFSKDWLGRIILPIFVGLYACVELFFISRKKPIPGMRKHKLLKEGMSKSEVDNINKVFLAYSRESGFAGWKIYVRQLLFSTVTTLAFSLLAGLIKLIFFH